MKQLKTVDEESGITFRGILLEAQRILLPAVSDSLNLHRSLVCCPELC